jgi:hypothetical protein
LRAFAQGARARAPCTAADLDRRHVQQLDLDLGGEPVDLARIDHPGAEVLGRLGAAGDAEAQTVDIRATLVARRDIAGEEGVARPNR